MRIATLISAILIQAHLPSAPVWSQTMPAVCYESICVGERVIDTIKRVGVVQGFEGNTAVYSSEFPLSAQSNRSFVGYLSKEIPTAPRTLALDPYNRTGEIVHTFENGFVLMKFSFGFSALAATAIRREILKINSPIGSALKDNEWVFDSRSAE